MFLHRAAAFPSAGVAFLFGGCNFHDVFSHLWEVTLDAAPPEAAQLSAAVRHPALAAAAPTVTVRLVGDAVAGQARPDARSAASFAQLDDRRFLLFGGSGSRSA